MKAFKQADYHVSGHGPRNLQVLKNAIEDLNGELESDMYGKGNVMEDFQKKMAGVLGKETTVFFPSGTMAQQIALRIWCDEKELKTVAYHPLCHLEIHEEDGLKELHHIKPILLADENRVISLVDVMNIGEEVACILLELPQREIGGQLPEYSTLEEISAYCREKGIRLHLDGARLFEVLPYYKKSAQEICDLFDSVYISVYKGIGGIAGAVLAGSREFTEKSKVWKRRHGGDLISLYPYILSADYYFDQYIDKMNQYYEEAKELAEFYNQCTGITTLPKVPVSNMFHVHLEARKEDMEALFAQLYEGTGIGLTGHVRENGENGSRFEVSLGDLYSKVPKNRLKEAFVKLDEKMKSK
ncbi:beta-eliminating lyase-related protein [Fictibacillus enclensis]|nr:beta-eliminating lyase-related protein [Fictibacillus enclensis]WHY74863.1 beta-eliminating lyase-related protein [Fictibacillus enclensis]